MSLLTDELRRILAETLLAWALRCYPKRTPEDVEVSRSITDAMKAATALLLRRAGA